MRGYTRLVALVGAPQIHHPRRGPRLLRRLASCSTGLLPAGFLPAEDAARTLFVVELPPGARPPRPSASRTVSWTRSGACRRCAASSSTAAASSRARRRCGSRRSPINLTPKNARELTQKQIEARIGTILRNEPDIRFWALREGGQRDLALIIAGPDKAAVAEVAARLQREAAQFRTSSTYLDRAARPHRVRIVPKPGVAADLGVSTDPIAETVRVGTIGDIGAISRSSTPATARFRSGCSCPNGCGAA